MTSVIKFEGTNMACMGGDEIMKEFENNTQQPCDDVVSREMALEKMADYVASGYADSVEDFEEYSKIICQLPPVTPSCDKCAMNGSGSKYCDNCGPKSGKWILLDECANSGYYCSECQKKLVKEGWSETVKKIKYCPNCGAKMVEPQERSDKE